VWARELGYPKQKEVCEGIRWGCRLGVTSVECLKSTLVSHAGPLLKQKVLKEVALGGIIGPLASSPIAGLQVSPLSWLERR